MSVCVCRVFDPVPLQFQVAYLRTPQQGCSFARRDRYSQAGEAKRDACSLYPAQWCKREEGLAGRQLSPCCGPVCGPAILDHGICRCRKETSRKAIFAHDEDFTPVWLEYFGQ